MVGPMLLLNIYGKPYMGNPMALSNLTLSDLEKSRSSRLSVVRDLYIVQMPEVL